MLMSSTIIPKEELTAFERWELASFDAPVAAKPAGKPTAATPELPQEPAVPMITAAELDNIRQQAHDEGYAQGQQEGHDEKVAELEAKTAAVAGLMQGLQDALNQMDAGVAQSLLDLSLEIARQMVRVTLETRPEVILKVVSDAISGLPHFNQNAHLVLHPDDEAIVREQMGAQLEHGGWKLFADAKLTRGGCRVETAHSHIDATVETRWRHAVESIGQDASWLA